MISKTYKVGGHTFVLNFREDDILLNQLSAFEPFAEKVGNQKPLFILNVVNELDVQEATKRIGTFDSDIAIFDVDETAEGGYIFTIRHNDGKQCGRLQISQDFENATVAVCDIPIFRQFAFNNSTMLIYTLASAKHYTLMMHASVIKQNGKGYLFLAKSGTGKSTHSSLWIKHIEGSELLNDDNPVVRLAENGSAIVYGSPWSGKTRCYKNDSAPIGAFVKISQSPNNHITENSTLMAFAAMLPSCSSLQWDKRVHQHTCDTISGIIQTTKVFALECRPDKEAALVCYNAIKG